MAIISNLMYYVEPVFRQSVLEATPDSPTKESLSKDMDERPYYREDFLKSLAGNTLAGVTGKGFLSALVASDAANKAAPVNSSEKPDCIK